MLPEASSVALANQLLGRFSTPSKAAQRAERKARLEESLMRMKPLDREVLLLRHFEEPSNRETAATLGISPKAANNRYARALIRLREILCDLAGGEESIKP